MDKIGKGRAPSGGVREDADAASELLDLKLYFLAGYISTKLKDWGVIDPDVYGVSLPRTEVKVDPYTGLPEVYSEGKKKGQKKRMDNVEWEADSKMALYDKDNKSHHLSLGIETIMTPEGEFNSWYGRVFNRRHIVSLRDMGEHYERSLNGVRVSKAKLLLEQRGSAVGARTSVGRDSGTYSINSIILAAKGRWRAFFNYVPNIFIGLARPNFQRGRRLDDPGWTKQQLDDHVAHIKRGWALDSHFTPTP